MSKENSKPQGKPAAAAQRPAAQKPNAGVKPSGRVQFDDRGNAIWEWSVQTGAFGRDVSTQRLKKLENPALSIADDGKGVNRLDQNPYGTMKGYNPYDSGKLENPNREAARKKDLRKLGEWLELRKQASANKQDKD